MLEKLFGFAIVFGLLAGLAIFLAAYLILPLIACGILYAAYHLYHNSQNTPEKLAAKQSQELQALYDRAVAGTNRTIGKKEFATIVYAELDESIPETVSDAALITTLNIYDYEGFAREIPKPPAAATEIEIGRYRDRLAAASVVDDAMLQGAASSLAAAFNNCFRGIRNVQPGQGPLAVPISSLFSDLPRAIERLSQGFLTSDLKALTPKTGAALQKGFEANRYVMPTDYKGADVVEAYLQDTLLREVFAVSIPIDIPEHVAYEHAVITAGTGHGKTTLLENLILKDLTNPKRPAIVVIDSQQALIGKLSRLAVCHERPMFIIDPKDAPALNPFDLPVDRLSHYDDRAKEQLFNHTLETFHYLFDSLLGADLTVRQGTLFNYIIMLMLAMPAAKGRNATLYDLIAFTEDPSDYKDAIALLDPIPQRFFQTDFIGTQYKQTREQIRYRLHAILGNPSLARLFLAPFNTIDFYDMLADGAIILVDTDKAFLGAKNSSYLGRIVITLLLQSILERAATQGPHRPVQIYIDEAGEYFDKSIETFLTEARKHRTGITLAHQHLGQMTPEFRGSVAANTATKYAGGLSAADARSIASDMRTSPQFLLDQPRLVFACYVRNVTPTALPMPVAVGTLDAEPQITERELQQYRRENRDRLSISEEEPGEAPEEPAAPQKSPPKQEDMKW